MKKRVTIKTNLVIIAFVALGLCASIAKLLYVALSPEVDGINLKKFAESRNEKVKVLHASRGSIYDNSGEVLALSVNSYKIIAYVSEARTKDPNKPQHVVDKEYTAKMLSPILNIPEADIINYLSRENAYQVEFGPKGKDLTESVKKKIDDLELPGIDFIEGTQRYYKMGNFASYIVGYAKSNDEDEIKGELGVESYYDEELSGKDGFIRYQSDAYGYQLPDKPVVEEKAQSGSNIYLTIDSNIQLIAENAIKDLNDNFETDWSLMTVMDAKTGAIVASATSPSYNPNDLNTIVEAGYLNPLVSYTYEPGSTMKIFSWASAIEEGIYDGEKTYMSGSIKVADATISDWKREGWGEITFDRGFMLSSNVAATKLAQELGTGKLTEYYEKFGFGAKTGIELSGEVAGSLDFMYETELATASFGQGRVIVTPIQMLQALTALTNKGIMLKPYIVDKIVTADEEVIYEGTRTEVRRTMKESTASKMLELMYGANYTGASKWWIPKTVTLLGKTGTAQMPNPSGGYLDGPYDTIMSLAGIFPQEDPRYIIYVAVQRIRGEQKDVANMTIDAVDKIASYANIAMETNTTHEQNIYKVDNYKSEPVENIKSALEQKELQVVVLGDGKYIINQYPAKDSYIVKGSKVFLVTNSFDYLMPDLKGWSISDVKTLMSLVKGNVTSTGYGYVKDQSILPGETLSLNANLSVNLEYKEAKKELSPINEDNKTEN